MIQNRICIMDRNPETDSEEEERMKTTICLLLAAILLFFFCSFAFADGGYDQDWHPVLEEGLPEYNTPPIPDEQRKPVTSNVIKRGLWTTGHLEISIEETGDFYDGGMMWIVSAEGGDGNYLYGFFVVQGKEENGKTVYYQAPNGAQPATDNNCFIYTFPENGKYQLWADVYDRSDYTVTRKIISYTVEVEGHEAVDFTVQLTGTPFHGLLTWTVNATGGSGQYDCNINLKYPEYIFDGNSTITYKHHDKPGNTLSYELLMSADYDLQVWVKDVTAKTWKYKHFQYSFHSADYPTLQTRIEEIAGQCRAAGCTTDYQKALWLHDWLTSNADYDYNYVHYGPDGVLLGGTGTCDSYAKAFVLLAQAVGLQAARVENVVHAWNAVQIDGSWSYLDSTWDDPGQGQEYHLYFGVPYSVISINHENFSDKYGCTSYQNSYYYKEPEIGQAWGRTLAAMIQLGLEEGAFEFAVQLPETYTAEGHTFSGRNTPGTVLADYLSILFARERNYSFGGKPVELLLDNMEFEGDYFVEASVDVTGKVLTVPDDMLFIGEEAFMGSRNVRYVILPELLIEVGDRAFADCDDLWGVSINSYDTAFGSDVFGSGNRHLTLLVYQGSTAEDYAVEHGLNYFYLEPEKWEYPDIPVQPDPQ